MDAKIQVAKAANKLYLAPWIAAVLIVGVALGAGQLVFMHRVKIMAFIRDLRWSIASYRALPVSGGPVEMATK